MLPAKTPRKLPIDPHRRLRRRRVEEEDGEKSLTELRRLILGTVRSRIDELENRPMVCPPSVASVLPEAVVLATDERVEELEAALEPTVTRAVTAVARRQPELYGEILAPTIGSAVRKAVRTALDAILERFDAALEQSCSIQGIRWRIEAARTGRPFAEVVLLHTLKYRVEQVFMIHTGTSLVLQHAVDPTLERQAPDQIAATLSAIDAFGREAFGPLPAEAHLEKFKLGDLTVYVSRDPSITLAAVLRGTPALEVEARIAEARARITVACQRELARFAHDVTPFEVVRPELDTLLLMARHPPRRRAAVMLAIAGAALVAGLVAMLASTSKAAHRRHAYLAALETTPGIIVTRSEWTDGRGRFTGLRDPLAEAPEEVVARHGLGPATFALALFVSLDPRIVRRRVERVLEPPPTVGLTLDSGSLRLNGVAPLAWIDQAILLARSLPGIERIETRDLRSKESLDAVRVAAARLEAVSFTFETGGYRIRERANALATAADSARAALAAARDARVGVCIEITGHADAGGADDQNFWLSNERAAAVADGLVEHGVDRAHLRSRGAGTIDRATRSVSLRLAVDEQAARADCGDAPWP